MDAKESMIQLIKRQIHVENTNVKEAGEAEKRTGSAAAKLLLNVIRLDSKKHADILKGMLEILKGIPPSKISWEHRVDAYIGPILARKELEVHLKREEEMIALVKEEMKHTEDEGLRFLLQHILADERKHHKILETIKKHLYKIS